MTPDNPPSHADIMEELRMLRGDITPLIDMRAELSEVIEVSRALKVGGKGMKWISGIATALLTLGGLMLAVRAMWQSWFTGQPG